MTTSYFSNISKIKFPISIAGKCPDWYTDAQYKKLAPKYEWWKEWHDNNLGDDWYTEKYYSTVLVMLDPKVIYKELFNIYMTDNFTLLCYESPEKFCHRHLVAQWFNDNGFSIKELV